MVKKAGLYCVVNFVFFFIFSPYFIVMYLAWAGRWVWRFWILKEEYGDVEKDYLTRKAIGVSELYWEVSYRQVRLNIYFVLLNFKKVA